MSIDEIYEDSLAVESAISSLVWSNAEVKSVFVGYEDHGLLTVSIGFEGDGWSQGFHNRNLRPHSAFKNFVEGWLKVGPIHGATGMPVRIGRAGSSIFGDLLAVRPIIKSNRIFWPGDNAQRFYAFNSDGSVMEAGL